MYDLLDIRNMLASMQDQIRRYRLKPDSFDDFIASMREHIVPLRKKAGFTVPVAWHDEEQNEFIWVVRWHGEGSFEDADQAYYDMPERLALPKQFDWVVSQDVRMCTPVDLS
jgi:hypothetical protein